MQVDALEAELAKLAAVVVEVRVDMPRVSHSAEVQTAARSSNELLSSLDHVAIESKMMLRIEKLEVRVRACVRACVRARAGEFLHLRDMTKGRLWSSPGPALAYRFIRMLQDALSRISPKLPLDPLVPTHSTSGSNLVSDVVQRLDKLDHALELATSRGTQNTRDVAIALQMLSDLSKRDDVRAPLHFRFPLGTSNRLPEHICTARTHVLCIRA